MDDHDYMAIAMKVKPVLRRIQLVQRAMAVVFIVGAVVAFVLMFQSEGDLAVFLGALAVTGGVELVLFFSVWQNMKRVVSYIDHLDEQEQAITRDLVRLLEAKVRR